MDGRVVLEALGMSLTGLPAGWVQDDRPELVDGARRRPAVGAGRPPRLGATELAALEAEVNIADLTGLEFATGLAGLQLGAYAYPRENGTRTCRRGRA